MTGQQKKLRLIMAPSEKADLLVQALVHLHKALKGAGFYPQGHPYRSETLQRAFEVLRALLAERELILSVSRQGFLLDGEVVEGNVMTLQFAHECFIRRVASIVFMQDLLLCDLEAFIRLLNADPHKTAGFGGFARQLEESGVQTIWINEKDLAAIWAKRGGPGFGEEAAEGWDGFASLEAAAEARTRDIAELLRLMAQEKLDARYQELGRELVKTLRGHTGGSAVLPVLEELLRQHRDLQRSLPQREYALFALEHVADGAADLLLDCLESRECEDKEGIHQVLSVLGGKGAYWIIQRICLAEGLFERKALATALVSLGTPAIAPLIAMLKDERWYVVRNMVSIIGELRSQECVVALKRPLYHKDVRVRKEAIRALMKIGGEPAECMLIQLLDELEEGVVRHAILSLGLMRSRQAVAPLMKLLERRDLLLKGLDAKKELAVALGRIGDRRATGLLLRMLATRGWPVLGRWLELKIVIASTLGVLGDEAALPALSALAAGKGTLAEACRDALDAIERVSGGVHD